MIARTMLVIMKQVARMAVVREKKLVEPREPNTVPDAPAPNAAPASAPLPRCSSTMMMMPIAISVWIMSIVVWIFTK